MRDNHEGMIEFIDAFEIGGYYFAIVELQNNKYQFGVSQRGYRTLKKAMQIRPFDKMPGLKYRYFYVASHKTAIETESYRMDVRIELNRDAAKEDIDIPKDLHANLLWFSRLEDLSHAEYLKLHCE